MIEEWLIQFVLTFFFYFFFPFLDKEGSWGVKWYWIEAKFINWIEMEINITQWLSCFFLCSCTYILWRFSFKPLMLKIQHKLSPGHLKSAVGISSDFLLVNISNCVSHMDMLEDVTRILYWHVPLLKYNHHEINVLSLSHNSGKDLKVMWFSLQLVT